jgi:hypothetical protein
MQPPELVDAAQPRSRQVSQPLQFDARGIRSKAVLATLEVRQYGNSHRSIIASPMVGLQSG